MMKERDKVRKASKRASETLHRQEQNRTHLACAEGSALQCCSLQQQLLAKFFNILCNFVLNELCIHFVQFCKD